MKLPKNKLRVGLVVPHLFMQQQLLPRVIFSPAALALELAQSLDRLGTEVTLYSPGPVDTPVRNVTADLSGFEAELAARGDTYTELLKKHPFTFITLARQAQAELVARAYADANAGRLDVVHVYTNEEELALVTADLCRVPVVFTHHDPFNFLVRYRSLMPRYAQRNWVSVSLAQRAGMPAGTNWAGNVYHGLPKHQFALSQPVSPQYVAYLGRIIEPKGVHHAITAVQEYNRAHPGSELQLRIAGKHYGGGTKDCYWQEQIEPQLGECIRYEGFIASDSQKQAFLGGAQALVVPSVFEEPFGMVMVEALACGTPVVGLRNGAIPEVITHGRTGVLVDSPHELAGALATVGSIRRQDCRSDFEARFTSDRMAAEHHRIYEQLVATK